MTPIKAVSKVTSLTIAVALAGCSAFGGGKEEPYVPAGPVIATSSANSVSVNGLSSSASADGDAGITVDGTAIDCETPGKVGTPSQPGETTPTDPATQDPACAGGAASF